MSKIKRSDWVRCKIFGTATRVTGGQVGIVRRVAANGEWADVDWHTHTKRMPTTALEVLHTIPLGGGVTVTDMTREAELKEADV